MLFQIQMISTPRMKKLATESLFSLSIFYLKKQKLLPGYRIAEITWSSVRGTQEAQLFVDTTVSEPRVSIAATKKVWTADLVKTSCNLGGIRYWFLCPNHTRLQKRVAILYFVGETIGCRECLRLTYVKQQRSYHGPWGAFRAHTSRLKRLEDRYARMRVKKFRGQPTKRFLQWVHDAEMLESKNACSGTKKVL